MQPDTPDIAVEKIVASETPSRLSWREKVLNWRNSKLADAEFHRWARRNPLSRYIARRRARSLFDLCAGFVYSQTLSACVELELFQLLSTGAKDKKDIAHSCNLSQSSCEVLIRSAISLKLLQAFDNNRVGLGIHGAALLANPGVFKMVEHHTFFYRDLKDPVALLRGEQSDTMLSLFWKYTDRANANDAADDPLQPSYTELMSASQSMIAEQIIDCYELGNHQCVLDVGGSDGTFLRKIGAHSPDLALMLFDLKPVIDRAENCFAEAGLPNEVSCISGNMFSDSLPMGSDLISLIRVIHDHNDEDALVLLSRCREALPAGGTLMLAEPMAVERVGDPATDAYFGLYLHAMGQGRPRTVSELSALLLKAGFIRPSEVKTQLPMLVRILTAKVSTDR